MRNTPASNNRPNSGAYGGGGTAQNAGYNNYRGNRGGGYNNRGGGMNNMSSFHRGGFQQPMNGGFQGSAIGGYQGTPVNGMQSYGGFQGRGGMAGGMRGGALGMRGGRGGVNTNPMMGMPIGGMGMGAMGAMSMSMPQMGGSMGMQGMTIFNIQLHVHLLAHCVVSAVPAEYHRASTIQPNRRSPSVRDASSPEAPSELDVRDNRHISSAWASHTQLSPHHSLDPPAHICS